MKQIEIENLDTEQLRVLRKIINLKGYNDVFKIILYLDDRIPFNEIKIYRMSSDPYSPTLTVFIKSMRSLNNSLFKKWKKRRSHEK